MCFPVGGHVQCTSASHLCAGLCGRLPCGLRASSGAQQGRALFLRCPAKACALPQVPSKGLRSRATHCSLHARLTACSLHAHCMPGLPTVLRALGPPNALGQCSRPTQHVACRAYSQLRLTHCSWHAHLTFRCSCLPARLSTST